MPTYDYKCIRCNKVYEVIKPMSESQKSWKCERCNVECIRLIGLTDFILKGKDWPGKNLKNKGN